MSIYIGKWRSPVAHSAGGRAVAGSNPVFPTTPQNESGIDDSAFWSDLRLIREAQKITLDQVHAKTRIPLSVLKDLESDGLKTHAMLNPVYARSLVQAYSQAIGVDPSLTVKYCNSTAAHDYDGSLATVYLGRPVVRERPQTEQEPAPSLASTSTTLDKSRRSLGRYAPSYKRRTRSSLDWTIIVVVLIAAIMAVVLVMTTNTLRFDKLASLQTTPSSGEVHLAPSNDTVRFELNGA